jgi:Fibronectin type III domain
MRRASFQRSARRRAALLAVGALAASLVATVAGQSAQAATLGPVPGDVAHPIGRVHLESFEWFNVLDVVDAHNRIVRVIKVADNPLISKPDMCITDGRIRVDYDYTYEWKLNYFTRMCAGRGIGTHAIPLSVKNGLPDMNAADLGKPPLRGAPLSHGCMRMSTADAEYIYDYYSRGVPIYFVKTPWRPLPPAPSAAVRATALAGGLSVSWLPAAPQGAPVTSYTVTVTPGGVSVSLPPTTTSLVVSGLAAGVPVQVRVVARSAAGTSAAAVSAVTVPFGPPGAPAALHALRAMVGSTGHVQLSWDPAPANGAPLTSYVLVVDGAAPVTLAGDAVSYLLPPVPYGATEHFTLQAVNGSGAGPVAAADLALTRTARW